MSCTFAFANFDRRHKRLHWNGWRILRTSNCYKDVQKGIAKDPKTLQNHVLLVLHGNQAKHKQSVISCVASFATRLQWSTKFAMQKAEKNCKTIGEDVLKQSQESIAQRASCTSSRTGISVKSTGNYTGSATATLGQKLDWQRPIHRARIRRSLCSRPRKVGFCSGGKTFDCRAES